MCGKFNKLFLPRFCTLHGKIIVSPIIALYNCPLDRNLGETVDVSKSIVEINPSVKL